MPCLNHPEVVDALNRCVLCAETFCPDCLVQIQGNPLCASCKMEYIKNVQSGVGVPGELPLAGALERFAAWFLDAVILAAVFLPLAFAAGFFSLRQQSMEDQLTGTLLQLFAQVVALVLGFVYEGAMLQWRGQTLGKMILKIKVVTPDGGDIAPGQAWVRALVHAAINMCCVLADCLPVLWTKDKTAVHDMAAKTRVVKLGS